MAYGSIVQTTSTSLSYFPQFQQTMKLAEIPLSICKRVSFYFMQIVIHTLTSTLPYSNNTTDITCGSSSYSTILGTSCT